MLPSPVSSPSRAALADYTNVERELSLSPARGPRKRAGLPLTPTSVAKRQRVLSGKGTEPAFARKRLFADLLDATADDSSDDETAQPGPSTRPARSLFAMRSAAARGQRPIPYHTHRM